MTRIIAGINMTIDGFCDHTAGIADEELHQHYTELLLNSGTPLYGRTTYQLMEGYWPALVERPSGDKSMDDFASAIDNIQKVVFSHTLKGVEWRNTRLARRDLEEEVLAIRQQPGKDTLVGSPSLIAALTELRLIDEFQLCIHPVIAGKGLPLFRNISDRMVLTLINTKTFGSGAVTHYYVPAAE